MQPSRTGEAITAAEQVSQTCSTMTAGSSRLAKLLAHLQHLGVPLAQAFAALCPPSTVFQTPHQNQKGNIGESPELSQAHVALKEKRATPQRFYQPIANNPAPLLQWQTAACLRIRNAKKILVPKLETLCRKYFPNDRPESTFALGNITRLSSNFIVGNVKSSKSWANQLIKFVKTIMLPSATAPAGPERPTS